MIHEDRLRELLTTIGDRFTDDEVDEMYKEAPIQKGMFDYNEFTKILKHGAKEKDEPWRSGWRIVDLLSLVPFLRELDFLKLILLQIMAFNVVQVCQIIYIFNTFLYMIFWIVYINKYLDFQTK